MKPTPSPLNDSRQAREALARARYRAALESLAKATLQANRAAERATRARARMEHARERINRRWLAIARLSALNVPGTK